MKMEMKKKKRIKRMKTRETRLYMSFTSFIKFHTPHVLARKAGNLQRIIAKQESGVKHILNKYSVAMDPRY